MPKFHQLTIYSLADEDLHLIFSRFGKILSCEVIRDKRTGDSLQYAFIEFDEQKDCEQAYMKMQNVLIDDHRIHVDFSQSVSSRHTSQQTITNALHQVSKLSDSWRSATNAKRSTKRGGWGGIDHLEKKRQYRAAESNQRKPGYGMVFDKRDAPRDDGHDERRQNDYPDRQSERRDDKYNSRHDDKYDPRFRRRERSRSPYRSSRDYDKRRSPRRDDDRSRRRDYDRRDHRDYRR